MNGGPSSMPSDRGPSLLELLVIGPSNSRRVADVVEAARPCGFSAILVKSYLDLLQNDVVLSPGTVVRLESPGGCPATTKALLKAGIAPLEALRRVPISEAEIDQLTCERGEMLHPRQWFLGWRKILTDLSVRWGNQDIEWMSTPERILTAFDKAACLENWSDAGLPIPRQYRDVSTYSELRRQIPERHARVFVKLRYGYSAMGAVALEWRDHRVRAITTVESVWTQGRPRLFLTKRPRQLQREFEIAWLIDTLGMEQIIVEDWLPKARWKGLPYDLRVVMINSRISHVVGRANASPFTNLNLDARRMSREIVEQEIGSQWGELNVLCERATRSLPGTGMLGLDVLPRPGCRKFALLEANAFGDFLPRLQHGGLTTYEAELQSMIRLSGAPLTGETGL